VENGGTRLTYPDASYITYDYDELSRMTAVRNSSGTALASYSFDGRSRRTGLTYANGAGANYSYDTASRLSYLDNQTGNGQHKYSYMYDNVGNRTSMMVTDSSGVRTHVYSYDDIYQITGNRGSHLHISQTDCGVLVAVIAPAERA
jgi:YD repeat-containing protein